MVKIQKERIDVLHYIELLKSKSVGSIVTFLGEPRRSKEDGSVTSINFIADKEEATKTLKKIEEEALATDKIKDIIIVHRIGNIVLKEVALFVGVSSAHRQEGFKICSTVVDKVKSINSIKMEIMYETDRNS